MVAISVIGLLFGAVLGSPPDENVERALKLARERTMEMVSFFEGRKLMIKPPRKTDRHVFSKSGAAIMPYEKISVATLPLLSEQNSLKIGAEGDKNHYIIVVHHDYSTLAHSLFETPAAEFAVFAPTDTHYIFINAGRCLVDVKDESCYEGANTRMAAFRKRILSELRGKGAEITDADQKQMEATMAEAYGNTTLGGDSLASSKVDGSRLHFVDSEELLKSHKDSWLLKRVLMHETWAEEFSMVTIEGVPLNRANLLVNSRGRTSASTGGEASPMYSCKNQTDVEALLEPIEGERLAFMSVGLACGSTNASTTDVSEAEIKAIASDLGDLTGKLAVIDRGQCTFQTKFLAAQAAGARAALLVTDEKQPVSTVHFSDDACTIPAFMVSPAVGQKLAQASQVATARVALAPASRPPNALVIDGQQRLRDIGHLRFPSLAETVPTARYLEYEDALAAQIAELAAGSASGKVTTVPVFDAEEDYILWNMTTLVKQPMVDAEHNSNVNKLLIELELVCPGRERRQCGEWDRVLSLYSQFPHQENREICRFVTGYSSPGHYLIDATTMLPNLLPTGEHKQTRITLATEADWATIGHNVTLKFHFVHDTTEKGAELRAVPHESLPLFAGGELEGYNAHVRNAKLILRPANAEGSMVRMDAKESSGMDEPVVYMVDGQTANVSVTTFTTGHGWGSDVADCAEYCNTEHTMDIVMTLKGPDNEDVESHAQVDTLSFPTAGTELGCASNVEVTPNQYGTWHEGRAGWCPGWAVRPRVSFLELPPSMLTALRGEQGAGYQVHVDITYRATFNGTDYKPTIDPAQVDSMGFNATINHVSYVDIWAHRDSPPKVVFKSDRAVKPTSLFYSQKSRQLWERSARRRPLPGRAGYSHESKPKMLSTL